MTRPLALGLVLLATAASATDLATAMKHAREASSEKPQWAPSATSKTTARASRNAALALFVVLHGEWHE